MITFKREFSLALQTKLPLNQSLSLLRNFLRAEGFSIASELSVHDHIRQQLGLAWPKYMVLVVWSPFLAYRALLSDRDAGIFMPFHFILSEEGEHTVVAATNCQLFARITGHMGLQLLARDVTQKIRQFFAQLAQREESSIAEVCYTPAKEVP